MTDKQEKFIAEYLKDFNATAAAKRAGYSAKTAYATGHYLLKNAEIKKIIQAEKTAAIADRFQREKFWSDTMLNKEEKMLNRLKASELLAKANGDFLDRQEIQATATVKNESAYDLSKLSKEELLTLRDILTKAQ